MEPPKDAIDTLVINAIDKSYLSENFELVDYVPFDASIKRTESTIRVKSEDDDDNMITVFKVTKGAPQVILKMSSNYSDVHVEAETKVIAVFLQEKAITTFDA